MENKEKPRVFLNSYAPDEIVKLFEGKENCKYCPFKMTFTGRIEFGQGDYHRFYCLFGYVFADGLGLITNTSPKETQKILKRVLEAASLTQKGINPNFEYPDIVRVHPRAKPDKLLLAVSVIRIKELNNCQIDRHKKGNMALSEEVIKKYNEYMRKYGRPEEKYMKQKNII